MPCGTKSLWLKPICSLKLRAKDDAAKPVFPNEAARNATFQITCGEHEELQNLIAERGQQEFKRAELFARLERLRLKFKLYLLEREAEIKLVSD